MVLPGTIWVHLSILYMVYHGTAWYNSIFSIWYTMVLQGLGGSAVSGVIAEMMYGQRWSATEYKKTQCIDTDGKMFCALLESRMD